MPLHPDVIAYINSLEEGATMSLHESTFEYWMPTDLQKDEMAAARAGFKVLADELNDLLPEGPDKTHVFRLLRTAAMWCNVAITRQPDGAPRV